MFTHYMPSRSQPQIFQNSACSDKSAAFIMGDLYSEDGSSIFHRKLGTYLLHFVD